VARRSPAVGMRAHTPARGRPARHGPVRDNPATDLPTSRATDREVGVVAAVVAAGSEKAAAHRLGLSHSTVKHHLANARSKVGAETTAQLVWILAPRLPEPTPGDDRSAKRTL
jgi:DNA-binding NarL/FixJ family response regulator